jgi:hypothetical protein
MGQRETVDPSSFPCVHCGESEDVGYHDDCRVGHWHIYRTVEDDGYVGYTLMGEENHGHNLRVLDLQPGVHTLVAELKDITWGQAKEIQTAMHGFTVSRSPASSGSPGSDKPPLP